MHFFEENHHKTRTKKRIHKLTSLIVVMIVATVGVMIVGMGSAEVVHRGYFVSISGNKEGDGSEAKPWDLATALSKSDVIQPGDTLWIRGGVYGSGGKTSFTSTLVGTRSSYVTVQGYPGETATINGQIVVNGDYSQWKSLEVTNSLLARRIDGQERPSGFDLFGKGSKVINCIIHDTGNGAIGFWRTVGDGGELYGNVIWGTGVFDTATNTPRGSPIYAQNQEGKRLIQNNISFHNATTAMKAYATNSYANGFTVDGNTTFDNMGIFGIFFESLTNKIDKTVITNNNTYTSPGGNAAQGVMVGLNSKIVQGDLEISGNYIANEATEGVGLSIKDWSTANVNDNTIIGRSDSAILDVQNDNFININRNTYVTESTRPFRDTELQARLDAVYSSDYIASTQSIDQYVNGRGNVSGSRYDRNSKILTDVDALPNKVVVTGNKYDPSRGVVTIYNWQQKPTVDVDLSKILVPGQNYMIKDVQNIFGASVATGTYKGGLVSLPTELTKIQPLIGDVSGLINDKHTPKTFNTYLIVGSSTVTTPAGISGSKGTMQIDPGKIFVASGVSSKTGQNTNKQPISKPLDNKSSNQQQKADDAVNQDVDAKTQDYSRTNQVPVKKSNKIIEKIRRYGWYILVGICVSVVIVVSVIYINEYRHRKDMGTKVFPPPTIINPTL